VPADVTNISGSDVAKLAPLFAWPTRHRPSPTPKASSAERKVSRNAPVAAPEIWLRDPRLPAFLDEVVLRNLQLGQSTVDVRVLRRNDTVLLDTIRTDGDVRVSIV
jgi:hypothetical protein